MPWSGRFCPSLQCRLMQSWPWIGTAENILVLMFILLAAWRTVAGLRDDLLERRRRLRPLLAILAVLYSVGQVFRDIFAPGQPAERLSPVIEAALLAALALAFALAGAPRGLFLDGPLRRRRGEPHGSEGPAVVPTPATEAETRKTPSWPVAPS